MSQVYKAIDRRRQLHDADLDHVAIKMTRTSVIADCEASLTLEREAVQTQRLAHPNIINIYDFDRHGDQFYLVMEWLEGESVKDLLRRTKGRQLAEEFVWQIIHGAASGLQHAHANNVVHADINLSNIFITDTRQIKLLDFGVARSNDDKSENKGREAFWVTRKYASPEVLSGSPPVFEDDIFSLACVAYRLLSGKHPFAGMNSKEAKEQGVSVQPIPELSEIQWQTIRRALSFARSDRPNTVGAFLEELPTWAKPGAAERVRRVPDWRLALPIAAVVLAGFWWLSRTDSPDQPALVSEPPLLGTDPDVGGQVFSVPNELDRLLSDAAQAMEEERYITPEDDNARLLYQNALVLTPENPVALAGLRRISDIHVRQANLGLSNDAPEEAITALTVATETDPDNPAIAMVNDLLMAQGNSRLASARLAAAEGNTEQAALLLAEAERFSVVAASDIDAVRQQITQAVSEQQFLRRLETADMHIAAGRLITPDGNNAHALLLELRRSHGDDPRLQASTERLSESLLAQAVVASADNRIPEAMEYLQAADDLGVMTAEIAAARNSLLRDEQGQAAVDTAASDAQVEIAAAAEPSTSSADESGAPLQTDTGADLQQAVVAQLDDAADRQVTDQAQGAAVAAGMPAESPAELAEAGTAADATTPEAESAVASPGDDTAVEGGSLQASATEAPPAATAAASDSGAALTDETPAPRLASLSELGIARYVAPTFPRLAERRRLTGSVELRFSIYADGTTGDIEVVDAEPGDVFVASAERAVRRWRFAPRGEDEIAQIKMRFE
jgi:TonB family protein